MPRPSSHLPPWYSLTVIALAIFVFFGFAGMWPAWLLDTLRWAVGALMIAVMAFALLLGLILAYILFVRHRR